MDVREKLVELLSEIIDGGFKWHNYLYESGEQLNNDDIASYLIANGVTVQEWVSVDDRLPKPRKRVLIYSRHDFCESAFYIGVPGERRVTWNHEMLDADSVTHWMPLPNPPKGE